MKKLLATASAIAMVLGTSVPAFAASNINTGAKSVNIAVESNRSRVTTRNLNLAGVVNVVGSSADSGNVKADKNTGGGNMALGGNATNKTTVTNNLGQTNSTVVGTCGCPQGAASNINTGYKSLNVAVVSNSSTVNTTNANGAFVLNLVSSSASTGNSSASMNTGGGNVASTGNASTTTTINNTVNQGNTTVVNP